MKKAGNFIEPEARLRRAGLRPTQQRLALAGLLWQGGDRHVTPEILYQEATKKGIKVALGTIYNTLHQFTDAGLLRELALESGRRYFDTNIGNHHHFYDPQSGSLIDIPESILSKASMPEAPRGMKIHRVDVVIHLSKK